MSRRPRDRYSLSVALAAAVTAAALTASACREDDASHKVSASQLACRTQVTSLAPGKKIGLSAACPDVARVCILSDDMALITLARDGEVVLHEEQRKSCPLVEKYNMGPANEIIGVGRAGCPFVIDDSAGVFTDSARTTRHPGGCIDPGSTSLTRLQGGDFAIEKGGS